MLKYAAYSVKKISNVMIAMVPHVFFLVGLIFLFTFPIQDIALASVSMRPMPFMPVLEKLSLSDKYG